MINLSILGLVSFLNFLEGGYDKEKIISRMFFLYHPWTFAEKRKTPKGLLKIVIFGIRRSGEKR